MCFVISPIGTDEIKYEIPEDKVDRIIQIVRADNINKSGIITQQILEHHFVLQIFRNPNVFYELGVRHTCQLPTIQIIRKADKIPFDVAQGRTIVIDTGSVYTIMDRFDSAKKELKEHLLKMVKHKGREIVEDNPIKIYLPELKASVPK